MTLTTKYLDFWTRVKKELVAGLLIVTAILVYSYFKNENGFVLRGLILVLGVIYIIVSLLRAKTFVNEVKFTDDKIIVTVYTFNTPADREFNIKASDIKIKSKGQGRGNVEYYLRLSSSDETVNINRSFNWDYSSLLIIFNEFKRIKGEKIIFDEKYFLDIIEKKANGFSTLDIASGRELRK